MAIDPATAKLLAKVAVEVATNEETRNKVLMIALVPIISLVIVIAGFQYILDTPFRILSDFFQGNDEQYSQEVVDDYGYAYSYENTSFNIGDYENVDAVDPEQFKKLLTEASKYIGMAYVWGGSSPASGFDCSGFVCWSYTKSGTYNLPRTTAQGIYNQCVGLPREEAQAGDLIFFQKTYKSDGAVSHIGIYLGNGKMLHCGDPIGITSIDTPYWTEHLYGFGRLGDGSNIPKPTPSPTNIPAIVSR